MAPPGKRLLQEEAEEQYRKAMKITWGSYTRADLDKIAAAPDAF